MTVENIKTLRESILNRCLTFLYDQVCQVVKKEFGGGTEEGCDCVHLTFPFVADAAVAVAVAVAASGDTVVELDFLNEAKNSIRCMDNFRKLCPHIAGYAYAPKPSLRSMGRDTLSDLSRKTKEAYENSMKFKRCSDGSVVLSAEGIKREAERHFRDFMNERPTDFVEWSVCELKEVLDFQCTKEDKQLLVKEVNKEEIPKVVSAMPREKSPGPMGVKTMKDYRPISCNVIYEIISKILANRLKVLLSKFITPNQSAFVKDRLLMENLLLVTEIIRNYHKKDITARCAMKIDISKDFDSVQWPFLLNVLKSLDMPDSARVLRQGCSLSTYLFFICINVLSKKIDEAARNQRIGLHPGCQDMNLTHLCFADDLMVFVEGNKRSIEGALAVLDDFAIHSGLRISLEKSTIYMARIRDDVKEDILTDFPFEYGTLPVTLRNFWMAAFRLPKSCINEIDKLCASFLWSCPDIKTRRRRSPGKLHLIRNNSFWPLKDNMIAGSWIWRKLLKYRDMARMFYKVERGFIELGVLDQATLGEVMERIHRNALLNQVEHETLMLKEQRVNGQADDFLWRLKDDTYSDQF
uniref:Reverse transcriptase domain-containing protein n=1 Tax=Tanacetum cinerariifolium TaxID=118510 RepID=A0A699GNR8_TANCI|nr:hypothetical protein [Tanacetum cinerariifolium]